MSKIDCLGPFKDYIKDYLELKRSIGYKYNAEEDHLILSDNYLCRLATIKIAGN